MSQTSHIRRISLEILSTEGVTDAANRTITRKAVRLPCRNSDGITNATTSEFQPCLGTPALAFDSHFYRLEFSLSSSFSLA